MNRFTIGLRKRCTIYVSRRFSSSSIVGNNKFFEHTPTVQQRLANALLEKCAVDNNNSAQFDDDSIRQSIISPARNDTNFDYFSTIALRGFKLENVDDDFVANNFDDDPSTGDNDIVLIKAKQFCAMMRDNAMIDRASVTAKGLVALRVSDSWLAEQTRDFLDNDKQCCVVRRWSGDNNNNNTVANNNGGGEGALRASRRAVRKTIVDFASPNMAKELHVGHLRSTVIGDSLCNLLEFLGHDVTRVSHVGDIGTPLALVIGAALRAGLPWTSPGNSDAPLPTAEQLSELYREARELRDNNASFAARVHAIGEQLHSYLLRDANANANANTTTTNNNSSYNRNNNDNIGYTEQDVVHTWQQVCEVSRRAFTALFARLGVRVEERGESSYVQHTPDAVARLIDAGLLRDDDGALLADVCGAPLVVRKRNGAVLYSTTDLAALLTRGDYDRAIYVVDASQQLHFKQVCVEFESHIIAIPSLTRHTKKVFELGRKGGLIGEQTQLEHVTFGVVSGKDGRKLSTRDGTGDTLASLLDEAAESVQRQYPPSNDSIDAIEQVRANVMVDGYV
jgi:hypothetical protein